MSELPLIVGQTAHNTIKFSQPTIPADGKVASDNKAVEVTLGSDLATWTARAIAVTDQNKPATITYTGTTINGAVVVQPMVVTVLPIPEAPAEVGDFDPQGATIIGP